MPELPEVEAVCRKLRRDATGARIISARLLHRPNRRLERRVAGRTIRAVERRGKNILLHLDEDLAIRVHLRMTGNLYVIADLRSRPPSTRAWFTLDGGRGLILDDPRALGMIEIHTVAELEALMNELGPEPLSAEFSPEAFLSAARRSARPAKLFLLDQNRIAGLGNIYAAEALHRARVDPAKPLNRLTRRKLERLHQAIVEVLSHAVQSACIAYTGPGQFEASETFPLAVYGREGQACPVCARRVRRYVQGGRSTYYCPGCQR